MDFELFRGALFPDRLSRWLPELPGVTLTLHCPSPAQCGPWPHSPHLPPRLRGWLPFPSISTAKPGVNRGIRKSLKLGERLSRGSRFAWSCSNVSRHTVWNGNRFPPPSSFTSASQESTPATPRLVFRPDDSRCSFGRQLAKLTFYLEAFL